MSDRPRSHGIGPIRRRHQALWAIRTKCVVARSAGHGEVAPRRQAGSRRVPILAQWAMIAQRLTSQMLSGEPARDPSRWSGACLPFRARTRAVCGWRSAHGAAGLTAADVDEALTEERSLVIGWLNRGTLHLVRSEDYHWLLALTAPARLTSNATRLAQEGLTPRAVEKGIEIIESSLEAEGPLTRAQLGERLDREGRPHRGPGTRPPAVRRVAAGPDRQRADRRRRACLRPGPRLARGPAADRPGARPGRAGAPLPPRPRAGRGAGPCLLGGASPAGRPCRLRARSPRSSPSASDGLLELIGRPPPAPLPPPRLLGAFDPILHGWRSREPIVGAAGEW